MSLHYGQYSDDGQSIEKDTEFCILTGRRIAAGDITASVPGTPYFVRVSARKAAEVTPAFLSAVKTAIEQEVGTPEPVVVPEKKSRKSGGETSVESGEG